MYKQVAELKKSHLIITIKVLWLRVWTKWKFLLSGTIKTIFVQTPACG